MTTRIEMPRIGLGTWGMGKVLRYGVSNFDVADMEAALALPQGARIAANQVFYNLARRGIERRLLPWCLERGIRIMAYSPLEQGRLDLGGAVAKVAARRGLEPAQVALAWAIRNPAVMALVKASRPEHVRQNAEALSIKLDDRDLAELDAAFPAPDHDVLLDTL